MKKLLVAVVLILMTAGSAFAGEVKGKSTNTGQSLLGSWQCGGGASIIFHSQNQLEFNGSPAQFELVPGAIRVQEDNGLVNYPYTLKGNNLRVQFPDGSKLQCARTAGQAGGQEHLLKGKLCSYSSSGSGYSGSSYSSSRWAYFDGRGNFSYGSESNFSSNAGLYSGSNPGAKGRYRVAGNTIKLHFDDGSTDSATVTFRNGSQITELAYGGSHYAMGMCQ